MYTVVSNAPVSQGWPELSILICDNFWVCNYIYSILGWNGEFILIGQNRSSNQRSGMILKVQIRSFSAPVHTHQSFNFQKILGGLNINIFGGKLVQSFLLQQSTNAEIQIWYLSFKTFFFLKKNTDKNFFLCVSALIQL